MLSGLKQNIGRKCRKWKLQLKDKGNAATVVENSKKIPSGNCDSGRSDGTVVYKEKVNIQMCKYRCDHGRSVTLR